MPSLETAAVSAIGGAAILFMIFLLANIYLKKKDTESFITDSLKVDVVLVGAIGGIIYGWNLELKH